MGRCVGCVLGLVHALLVVGQSGKLQGTGLETIESLKLNLIWAASLHR